jgi:putative endonuclease
MSFSDANDPGRKERLLRGRRFEKLAAKFYKEKGFTVLERNWQAGHKEIDLIVGKDELIVFVEVKSSGTRQYGHPAERIDKKKVTNLTEAARRYVVDREIEGCDLRFDVVTFLDGELEHFPDAFAAE